MGKQTHAATGSGAGARKLLFTCAVGALFACSPDTDLTIGGASVGAGVASPGPAAAELVDPVPGTIDVPVNLEAIIVRFPQPVTWGADSLRVCGGADPGSAAVATGPPSAVPCDTGSCYRSALGAALPAGVTCDVALGPGVTDARGDVVPPGLIGRFQSASAPDTTPPELGDVSVASAGPCLTVSFSTDEPATGMVSIEAGGVVVDAGAGVGKTRFEVAVSLGALPPGEAATVSVQVSDRAGNVAGASPLPFTTPPALPPLAITEVLANAAGPEPAQEYVELRNLGTDAVVLSGLRLEDGKGSDDLPVDTLPPGGYALVVASTYDPAEGEDPAPRPGTLLLRVDARIGSDGLANSGEPVRLMSGDAVVSTYGGWVDTSSTRWAGRSVHRLIQTACDRPDAWNHLPLEPTPGAGPPLGAETPP